MKRASAGWELQVLEVAAVPGGDRRLVYTECGEYLVVERIAGEIRRLRIYDTLTEAWQAWRENEAQSEHYHREHNRPGGDILPGLACP